jgi:hypothetical protein
MPRAPDVHQEYVSQVVCGTAISSSLRTEHESPSADQGDDSMPTIIGHHDISKGKDQWLNSTKRDELFGQLGVTNIRTFVNPEDPTKVALLMDVPDMDAFASTMQSEAAAAAMEHDGVMPETLVILVEE